MLKHNCNKIVLSVDKQNVHAREVYEHLDFKPTNETSQDKQLDFYEKPLNLPKKQNIQAQKHKFELLNLNLVFTTKPKQKGTLPCVVKFFFLICLSNLSYNQITIYAIVIQKTHGTCAYYLNV